jgi:hypothetical protein
LPALKLLYQTHSPYAREWFDAFAARPSMRATPLAGEMHD